MNVEGLYAFCAPANVPFAVASAYDKPERFGGEVLADAPNAGKPTDERRLLAVLAQLTDL